MKGRVLVVDDDASMCDMLVSDLGELGFEVKARAAAPAALDALVASEFDAVVADLNMPGMTGLELCERIVASRPDVPVIVITAFGSIQTAIAAIRSGAYDFVTKPLEVDALALALERAIQHRALSDEVRRLRQAVEQTRRFGTLLGTSPAMRRVYELLDRIADSNASVLITGETGTGKELVARALHERGRRKAGPFVAVDCASIPEPLLESELFGHARGAFTDARAARTGLMVQANGGTLFLDEIGDLPLALQPKLLRVLQERRVRPVGSDVEVPFDVRLVCATNQDLESAVEERRFREDLYFRVNVIAVKLPPLRSRGGDVLLLAQHFLDRCAAKAGKPVTGISPDAAKLLLAYPWPGNVRELRSVIERALILHPGRGLAALDLAPEPVAAAVAAGPAAGGSTAPGDLTLRENLNRLERSLLVDAHRRAHGVRREAARLLGIDARNLAYYCRKHGLDPDTLTE
jgi:DNA-binding NtrC family response regulator